MTTNTSGLTSANLAFSGFLFSILSLVLVEALNFKANAGVRQHILAASVGLLISAVALRRCRIAWPGLVNKKELTCRDGARSPMVDAAGGLLLTTMGAALALLTLTQSVTLFGIGALCISLTPWSRIPFCRNHFFSSCATVLISGACGLLIIRSPADPFILILAAWSMSMVACVAVLCAAFAKVPVARDPRSQHEARVPESSLHGAEY